MMDLTTLWALGLGLAVTTFLTFKDRWRKDVFQPIPPVHSCLVPESKTETLFFDVPQKWELPEEDYFFFTPDGRAFFCRANEAVGERFPSYDSSDTGFFDRDRQEIIESDTRFFACLSSPDRWIFEDEQGVFVCIGGIPQNLPDVTFNVKSDGTILPKTSCAKEKKGRRKRALRSDVETFLTKRPRLDLDISRGGDVFLECDGDNFIESISSCGVLAVFDEKQEVCTWRDFCSDLPNGVLHSHQAPEEEPLTPSEYLICENGISVRRRCEGEREVFDWALRRCRDMGPCFEKEPGFRFPHETNERVFFECDHHGESQLRTCPGYSRFIEERQRCEDEECNSSIPPFFAVPLYPWSRSDVFRFCQDGLLRTGRVQQPEVLDFTAIKRRLLFTMSSYFRNWVELSFPRFTRVFDEKIGQERNLDPELDLEGPLTIFRNEENNWGALAVKDIGQVEWDRVFFFDEITSPKYTDRKMPLMLGGTSESIEQRANQKVWIEENETGICETLFEIEGSRCTEDLLKTKWSLVLKASLAEDAKSIYENLIFPRFIARGKTILRILNGTQQEETVENYSSHDFILAAKQNFDFYEQSSNGPILKSTIFRKYISPQSYYRIDLASKEHGERFCENGQRVLSKTLPFCVPDNENGRLCIRDRPFLASRGFPDGKEGWSFYDESLTTFVSCGKGWSLGEDSWMRREKLCEEGQAFDPISRYCEDEEKICARENFFVRETMQEVRCVDGKIALVRRDFPSVLPATTENECSFFSFNPSTDQNECYSLGQFLLRDYVLVTGEAAFYPSLWKRKD